jgi:non-heme chloroperoxidase
MNSAARTFVILLLAWFTGAHPVSATNAWTDKSPHKAGFITVNGVRLHYLDWGGSGGTLLLLTGMGNSAHIYDDLAPKFTNSFHVLSLTRRGHGQSEKPETGYDTATLVEDIRQFLDAMKIQRVVLVGHSLAGGELTMFAAKYPQRVEKLVYLDAAYDLTTSPEGLFALFPPYPEHDNKSYDASKAWCKKFYRVMTPAIEADLRAGYVLHDDGSLEDVIPARVYKALFKFAQPNPAYSEVKAPALSFYADDFWPDMIPKENREKAAIFFEAYKQWRTVERERFRQGMPHARIVLMPDTSHYCFIQREGEVVREMRAFLLQSPQPVSAAVPLLEKRTRAAPDAACR